MKHTTGPWTIEVRETDSLEDGEATILANDAIIASIAGALGYTPSESRCYESEANAHLIAAAPDLLAALHAIVAKFESDPDDLETMDAGIKIARAAIAKAEGRS